MPSTPTRERTAPDATASAGGARPRLGAVALLLGLTALVLVVSTWHLTQGTSGVGPGDLWRLLTGGDTGDGGDGERLVATRDILWGSRVPRLAAGLAVGFALGVAGALFQSVARNALASPDTLAVTAGAFLAVTAVAALGLSVPLWASGGVAFVGGLLAAGLVLLLAGGAGTATTRLVLAGSAVAMALQAGTSTLLLLFEEETSSLFAWGSGSLTQLDLRAFTHAAPLVVLGTVVALLLGRRLDVLGMGDDAASALGVPVRTTRSVAVLLAVLLTAASVTLAGPIGFVGLFAPAAARLLARVAPVLHRHAVLVPVSGLVGALAVVLADAVVRALIGPAAALEVPTGVTTTMLGALVLVVLARRGRDAGPTRRPAAGTVAVRSRARFAVVLGLGVALLVSTVVVGLLAGSTWLRTGDVALWLSDQAPAVVSYALDERAPRVTAAVLAGAALALSGCLVQASCRNPLAEPGILGITGGAGVGAVIVVTTSGAGQATILAAAVAAALVAFATVYLLAWRGGLDADRLVLVGIGLSYAATALTTYLLVRANPFDTPRIFTFLSGTTYARTWDEVAPVALALLVGLPLAWAVRRELDLLALDEDTPRLVGVPLERVRLLVLTVGAVLAATSVVAVGVVGFVGLVAPHAARALVGGHHVRVVPVAVLLGAVLLAVADALGRTVIAPAQLPAGLLVALIGAPYFVLLLSRSRT